MKKFILLVLIALTSLFSQIENNPVITKTEYLNVDYNDVLSIIQIQDYIIYIVTDNEIFAYSDSTSNLRLLSVVQFRTSADAKIVLNQNGLYISQNDTIYKFSISNPEIPVLKNKWQMPQGYTALLDFGPYLIMRTVGTPRLIVDTGDSLKTITELNIFGGAIRTDYPYITGVNGTTIYLQKMISDYSINVVNSVALTAIYGYNMDRRRIVVYEEYVAGSYQFPYKYVYLYNNQDGELTLSSKKLITIPIGLQIVSYQNANYYYLALRESGDYNITGMNIRSSSGSILHQYPFNTKAFLGKNRYYGVYNGIYREKTLCKFSELLRSFPIEGWLIKSDDEYIYLCKKNEDNTINITSQIQYAGSLINSDSAILVKKDTSIKVFKVNQDDFILYDNFYIPSTVKNMHYYDQYMISSNNIAMSILKKENNSFKYIYNDQELTRGSKSALRYPYLYFADSVKGVFRYKISENSILERINIRYSASSNYTLALKHPYLFVRENSKLLIYDVGNDNPVKIDSLNLNSSIIDVELIVTQNNVYLQGKINSNSILLKLKRIFGKWNIEYTLDFEDDIGVYSLTEDHNRILVTSLKKMIWIKDTLIVLDSKEKNPITEIRGNSLEQNYPNPFNPSTKISYSIAQRSRVSIRIYDIMGREIETLIDKEHEKGAYEIDYTPKNLSSGIYFYALNAENYRETKKLIFLK